MTGPTAYEAGRLDAARGAPQVLFGRTYEDAEIEASVFPPGGKVFCIASAGCTAIRLARDHTVTAVDINPAQLEYAARRLAGAPMVRGSAERVVGAGLTMMRLAGWSRPMLERFLALDDPPAQLAFWKRHFDTFRFRAATDVLFSVATLRTVYAPHLLGALPARFGAVMRARMERCFRTHPNRSNPWVHALLLGAVEAEPARAPITGVELVRNDAAAWLEQAPAGSLDGIALSNILDGTHPSYRDRLMRAVKRAAAPGAMVVMRSFSEPDAAARFNRAAEDRSMLWGIVDVRRADEHAD